MSSLTEMFKCLFMAKA